MVINQATIEWLIINFNPSNLKHVSFTIKMRLIFILLFNIVRSHKDNDCIWISENILENSCQKSKIDDKVCLKSDQHYFLTGLIKIP